MGLFKSKKQREMEAEIRFRQGLSRIRQFVNQCTRVQGKYWLAAKESVRLGDREQFRQLAGAYLRTRATINRWERYLLQLETLGIRRNEVAATGEFLKSMDAMTKSIMRGASAAEMAKMQTQLQEAIVKSEQLEQTLSIAMDAASESIYATDDLSDEAVDEVAEAVRGEVEGEESGELDATIDKTLGEIEQRLRKELKQ